MTWDEAKHPRVPEGRPGGGQFTDAGAAARAAAGLEVPTGAKTFDEYRQAWAGSLGRYAKRLHETFGDDPILDNDSSRLYWMSREYEDSHQMMMVEKLINYSAKNGTDPLEYIDSVEEHYQGELQSSDVYMRITNASLKKALQEGEFKNTFMTGRTKAAFSGNGYSYAQYAEARKQGEDRALGTPSDYPEEWRPIYGYWSQDENAGFGARTDWLEQYGSIAVKFRKSAIADNLTFTSADSLDNSHYIRSSDWRAPSVYSVKDATADPGPLDFFDDTPDNPHSTYWEAQIWDRSTSNIEEVIFYTGDGTKVQPETTRLLDRKGIPWRILNE